MVTGFLAPQPSLWRELKRSPLFGLGLILTLVGTVLTIHFGGQGLLQWRLARAGVMATATVVDLSRGQTGGTARPSLRLTYRDAAGEMRQTRKTVRSSAYHVGEELQVIHDPLWPSLILLDSELGSPRELRELSIMGAAGLLMACCGWPLLLRRWRRARLTVALLRHGRRCEGEILEMRLCAYKAGNHQPRYFRYAFKGPDGRRREGNSDPLPLDLEDRLHAGDQITILCDRRRPDRHLPFPDPA